MRRVFVSGIKMRDKLILLSFLVLIMKKGRLASKAALKS